MKKYLFGLGAMLVGAGLMFIFTHTEVSADDMKESHCEMHKGTQGWGYLFLLQNQRYDLRPCTSPL